MVVVLPLNHAQRDVDTSIDLGRLAALKAHAPAWRFPSPPAPNNGKAPL
jgi:hypothetical protein